MTLIHSLPAFEIPEEPAAGAHPAHGEGAARLEDVPSFLFPNRIDTNWARSWLTEPLTETQ